MRRYVVFFDLFSILAIALFVLFVVSSGEESPDQKPSYQVYQLRISRPSGTGEEGRQGVGDLMDLYAVVCKIDGSSDSGSRLTGEYRIFQQDLFDGIRVVISKPPKDASVRFGIRNIKSGELYSGNLSVFIEQIYPTKRQMVIDNVQIGIWPEPSIALDQDTL